MKRPTRRGVAPLELLIADAALDRNDFRVAKFALELYVERRTRMVGPIRLRDRGLSRALDALVLLSEAA